MKSPLTTLCYIERDGCYLMLHRVCKENDENRDKWIGIGGHFEEGESPEECLLREAKEETGLELRSFRFRGLVTFVSDIWGTEYMCLYTAEFPEEGVSGVPDLSGSGQGAATDRDMLTGQGESMDRVMLADQGAATDQGVSMKQSQGVSAGQGILMKQSQGVLAGHDLPAEEACRSGIVTDEGILEWVPKTEIETLNLWEGDKIFLRLLAEEAPFFSLKLRYEGDVLVEAVLDGRKL